MINKELADKLNIHMTKEYSAAYIYLQMSVYLNNENLIGAASFMRIQAEEEIEHGNKIKDYLEQKGYYPTFGQLEAPKSDYNNIKEVMETALAHEKVVTSEINELYQMSLEQNEYSAQQLLAWFVTEQDEEEEMFNDLLARYEIFGNDNLALFDQELGQRPEEEE